MDQAPGLNRNIKPLWLSLAVALVVVAIAAWVRLALIPYQIIAIGYGVPLVIFVWLDHRRVLWATAAAFAIISVIKFFRILNHEHPIQPHNLLITNFILLLVDLVVITAIVDWIILNRRKMLAANASLESANAELAQREEEIARQNQEMQSQTEELERQSEELRVANEELAQRERMLETLLDLSRALTVELTQGQIMDRICETLWHLVNGSSTATAILLRDPDQPDQLEVMCDHGFGAAGVKGQKFSITGSFAQLVLSQLRTGYVEDLTLRPDLHVPRPTEGEPIRSIMAAPLMVRGKAVGTLEIYSRDKRTWSDEQIALAESLAAQASISIENGMLFEDIERERTRLSAVLRAVPFGIIICNGDCSELRANPAAAAMLNVPAESKLTLPETFTHISALRDGQALAPEEHPVVTAARTGREIHGDELEWILSGGRRIHVLISAVPIRERDGRISGAISVKADISQLKVLQRELDLRRREAEEANVRKTRFLAAASHDIRTPANAISLLAELIKRTAGTPQMSAEVPQLASELHASALSLVDLVTNVLDVTRFDSDKLELRESDFPLGALLEEETRQASPLAEAKKIKLEFERPNPPLWLRADRIKLGRVLGNLLSNAIKFTDDGSVRVTTRRLNDGALQIAVTDTGIGIAPQHLAQIFDEFYQITDPNRSKGSGLGLAISKRLIEAMGGDITVRSQPGEGSTFTITLPLTTILPKPAQASTASRAPSSSS